MAFGGASVSYGHFSCFITVIRFNRKIFGNIQCCYNEGPLYYCHGHCHDPAMSLLIRLPHTLSLFFIPQLYSEHTRITLDVLWASTPINKKDNIIELSVSCEQ